MDNKVIDRFLNSFFRLFNASIANRTITGNKVFGRIAWNDEDAFQDFSWVVEYDEIILTNLQELCDYLHTKQLINGDKFIISEVDLEIDMIENGWSLENANNAIEGLCNIEIKMIDAGLETDSFFVHF